MRYALSPACTYREEFTDGKHVYIFSGPCLKTGKSYSVTVPAEGLFNYNQGHRIQEAFPDMPAGDREFLMSGYSPEGFDMIFPPEEDEDDSDDDSDGDGDSDIRESKEESN